MPYQLRPEHKRKRPTRYKDDFEEKHEEIGEDDVDDDGEPYSMSSFRPPTASPPRDILTTIRESLLHLLIQEERSHFSAVGNTIRPTASLQLTEQGEALATCDMANTRSARKGLHDHDGEADSAPVAGKSKSHARYRQSAYSSSKELCPVTITPAAFPSLRTGEILLDNTCKSEDRHGVLELMNARARSDQKAILQSMSRVADMYANKKFPPGMSEHERSWYVELRKHWQVYDSHVPIMFQDLYYTLRNTIMDEIRTAFSDEVYHDPAHPIKVILGLSDSVYRDIMKENSKPWTVEAGLPAHVLEIKRRNLAAVIDPDMPPWPERVQAIKFLKQIHLSGSLLGEWQFPLPPPEVFPSWSQCLLPKGKELRSGPDYPNVLAPEQTNALIRANHESEPTNPAKLRRKMQDPEGWADEQEEENHRSAATGEERRASSKSPSMQKATSKSKKAIRSIATEGRLAQGRTEMHDVEETENELDTKTKGLGEKHSLFATASSAANAQTTAIVTAEQALRPPTNPNLRPMSDWPALKKRGRQEAIRRAKRAFYISNMAKDRSSNDNDDDETMKEWKPESLQPGGERR